MRQRRELQFEESFTLGARAERDSVELPASAGAFLIAAAFLASAVGVAAARVGFLGLVRADAYAARAALNARGELTLPANRGVITDRFGEPIVENSASFSVFLDAAKFFQDSRESEALAAVAGIIGTDVRELRERLAGARGALEREGSLPLVRGLSAGEAIQVRSLPYESLVVLDDYERSYRDGPAFAHVVGYTGLAETANAVVGKAGIEAAYDAVLRGAEGAIVRYRDAVGAVFETRVLTAPAAGAPLRTTIDAGLEREFYRRMMRTLDTLDLAAGVGIALRPKTGEVLALVSVPSFDNNAFVARSRSAEREALLRDPGQPLFNRAIAGRYTPGSTIKPLHALAALREGVVAPTDEIYSAGAIEIPNPYNPDEPSRFKDWKAHGAVDARSALARSSNIYFYGVGGGFPPEVPDQPYRRGLGIEKLRGYWERFGLGRATGIDLPAEERGFLPTPEEKERRTGSIWRLGDTYNVSIGQGDLLLTPIQLLAAIASIGNNGKAMTPYLVPRAGMPKVSSDYSDWTRELGEARAGLEDAVAKPYGTAHTLAGLPMTVAGKTGSAQIENNRKTNAFFVGYAPADDPEIAILVLIENAREGSLNAVPLAGEIFWWYYENRMKSNRE